MKCKERLNSTGIVYSKDYHQTPFLLLQGSGFGDFGVFFFKT